MEQTAKLSVLDRLVDFAPRESTDRPVSRDESVASYRASVLRDVEWLLNTRRTTVSIPDALPELQASTFAYGLPDLSSLSSESAETRSTLIRHIERTIRLFEPRLMDVRVAVAASEEAERQVHFTIEGLLKLEPDPERVVFDTVVELSRGDFSVSSQP